MVTASGLKIKKLMDGSGPSVAQGDLIGVRFKGNYGAYEFDNIFNTAEPLYTRAGVGTLVKVRHMWHCSSYVIHSYAVVVCGWRGRKQ